jgi:CRP-like cAMP-binding protein
MLNELPVPSIEHLASRLRHRTFPEATVLFEQGDPGGAYYVIVDGKAEVVGDGAPVAVLGPGDSFGEIALVNDVPRTATVRASTTLEVFELDRDAFLNAIGSSRATSDAAAAAVARHLANFTPGAMAV